MSAESAVPALDLEKFDVDPERGFLPPSDPLTYTPNQSVSQFLELDYAARRLPKLLVARQVGKVVEQLPKIGSVLGLSNQELSALKRDYDFLKHSYVWEDPENPRVALPENFATSSYAASQALGMLPVLCYKSYALDNWCRIDRLKPVELGNIALIRNFWGGLDEEWFILIHVDIEAKIAPAIATLGLAQKAVYEDDCNELHHHLIKILGAQEAMQRSMLRMPECCDPYTYFHRVRPFLHVPEAGLTYEGVEEYGNVPQKFNGETGAQGTVVPSLDAFFGIEHANDHLVQFLKQMRKFMPPKHRDFIDAVKAGPSVRQYIENRRHSYPDLMYTFDSCVRCLKAFRDLHHQFAKDYIFSQKPKGKHNPHDMGTGKTPHVRYLGKHASETTGIE